MIDFIAYSNAVEVRISMLR